MKNITRAILLITILFSYIGDLVAQKNMTFKSRLQYPGKKLANVWGHVDGTGKEYALVGTSAGISIVDVTVPDTPVEKFTVAGPTSDWREIRTKGNYAFVTTEGGSSGLQIVNLNYLPDSIQYKQWLGSGAISNQLHTIHALQVDGNFLYLYGSNINDGATIIVNVTDPWNPVYVNQYIYPASSSGRYVHDGYVRNDTMYQGHIYGGFFSIVNVSNKSNPVLLATQNTPGNFTHNTWLSDNGRVLYATDEVSNSFLTAYDITNLSNIRELSRIQSNPGSGSIVHNVHVFNDYCVTSWYKDGFVVVDGHRPENLVIVGNYDTYPSGGGDGFNGCWGVYPYMPSGNILASDIDNGLFVISPKYVRACYLEGYVTDSLTTAPLNGVLVEILSTTVTKNSNLLGLYKTGLPDSGTYTVRFSKTGYITKTITGVQLSNGVVTNLNVQLSCLACTAVSGMVKETGTGNPLNGATVRFSNTAGSTDLNVNVLGNFSASNFIAGTYNITIGKWGYVTKCFNNVEINSSTGQLIFELDKGIYDDFTFDFGWTVSGNAPRGIWERGEPVGTFLGIDPANPENDVTADCSEECYVTGNGGGTVGFDDVDDGNTILNSPVFDPTGLIDPVVKYYRWFVNGGGSGSPNDSLIIKIENGTSVATLEIVTANSTNNGTWVSKTYRIADFITPSTSMKLRIETADWPSGGGHIVEAAFDKFEVVEKANSISEQSSSSEFDLSFYPNPCERKSLLNYSVGKDVMGILRIEFIDLTGRIVFIQSINEPQGIVDFSDKIHAGIYFARLVADGKQVSLKKVILTN